MVEEEKVKIGKKGVLAKRAAIGKTCKDVQKAAKDISQEGQRRMSAGIKEKVRAIEEAVKKIEAGVAELQSAIQEQVKENEEAVAKIGEGTKAVIRETRKLASDFRKYSKEDFSGAVKGLQSKTKSFIKNTVGGYTRDFWYG